VTVVNLPVNIHLCQRGLAWSGCPSRLSLPLPASWYIYAELSWTWFRKEAIASCLSLFASAGRSPNRKAVSRKALRNTPRALSPFTSRQPLRWTQGSGGNLVYYIPLNDFCQTA